MDFLFCDGEKNAGARGGAGVPGRINFSFGSSAGIRHKSDSIQLTAGLQRDRIENGADSFHCDRIVPSTAGARQRARKTWKRKRPRPCLDAAAHRSAAQRRQSALILVLKRDSLRAAVFLWTTPLPTLRCSSGCASAKAARAASLSPLSIAVSTFFMKVRRRDTRARLTAVRRSV